MPVTRSRLVGREAGEASTAGRIVVRGAWAALLVGHAPLLLSSVAALWAGAAGGQLFRVAILALALAFFALKVVDVRWLRLAPGWRPLCAFSICVVLLHADVLRRNHVVASDVLPGAVLVAISAGAVAIVVRLLQGAPVWVAALRVRRIREAWRQVLSLLQSQLLTFFLPPRFLLLARACAVHRAPPAHPRFV